MRIKGLVAGIAAATLAVTYGAAASAGTCTGNCGTDGADGVVTLSPTGNASYQYVTTSGGIGGVGEIAGVGGSNGSEYVTGDFTAAAGDALKFDFNFLTSDGAGFSDYAWSELQTSTGAHVAWLFTGRTQPSGNTSPGFGLPANDSTLTPGTSGIIGGGPVWSPLGGSSGACYSGGCGYTGWIQSSYSIASAGSYRVVYGVTNWGDYSYDTGLAFDGLTVGGKGVGGVPEPTSWALMLIGLGGLGGAARFARRKTAVASLA